MNKTTGKALLVGATAILATSLTAWPAAAATQTKYIHNCDGGTYCIGGKYWYTSSTSARHLTVVDAYFEKAKKGRTYYAHWSYKKPGGSTHTSKWRKATVSSYSTGTVEAHAGWGDPNSTGNGTKLPKGTVLCTQFKGSSTKKCSTLK